MPMFRRQSLLGRTVFLLCGKVGIWKQGRELVIISEPKSTAPLILPADKVTQSDIPLGLKQTSLRHGRHIKQERNEIIIGNFSLDGSSHQTGDAAFTPAMPHDLHHSRANNDSHNSHNTQHTRVKQSTLCYTLLYAKGHSAQPDMFWRTHHTKSDPKIDAGDASLLMGSIN